MDPFTAFTVATVAKTGLDAVGSLEQGKEGYTQGMIESQAATTNAAIARENARRARLEASAAEEAQRREARKSLGGAAAAIAQAGIGSQGSAQAALTQGVREAELDALNIRYGGETEAHGDLVEAANQDAEAKAAQRRAKYALKSGRIGAASAIVGGAANYVGGKAALKTNAAAKKAATYPAAPKRGPIILHPK